VSIRVNRTYILRNYFRPIQVKSNCICWSYWQTI